MRSLFYALYLSLFLIAVIHLPSFSQTLPADSSSTDSASVQVKVMKQDTTTFFNHLYHRIIYSEPGYIYRNLGAVIDYNNSIQDNYGLRAFSGLVSFPVSAIRTNSSYIFYLKGSKLEQAFSAGFRQRLFNRFVLEGNFRNINSPGFFINQQNKIYNYHIALQYRSRNEQFFASVYYQPSVLDMQVNGGVANDSLADNIENNAGKSLEVYLTDASVKYRRKRLASELEYAFNKTDDTKSNFFIHNSLRGNIYTHTYNSATVNPEYYSAVYFDSTLTSDSMYFADWENFSGPGIKIKHMHGSATFKVGAGISDVTYHNFSNQQDYRSFISGFSGNVIYDSSVYSITAYTRHNEQYDAGFEINATAELKRSSYFSFAAFVSYQSLFPKPFYNQYISNHFIWSQDFNNTIMMSAGGEIGLKNKRLSLKAAASQYSDYIYFNQDALPAQASNSFLVFKGTLNANYRIYRHWNFYSDITFQKSESSFLPLPAFLTYSSVYHESRIFKEVMKITYGAGVSFFSTFKANAFQPATSQFYLQDDKEIGGYPYLDAFVNFRIKTVDFFIRIENAGNGLIDGEAYYGPSQPAPGRTLKVGIRWMFNDNQLPKR